MLTENELIAAIALFRKETEDLITSVLYQYYFFEGARPYTDTNEVLTTITVDNRIQYMTVNVNGVEYWFLPDLTTLVEKTGSVAIGANTISLDKLVQFAQWTVLYRRSAGTGNMEANTLEQLKEDLGITDNTELLALLDGKVDKVDEKSLVSDALILKIHDKFADDEVAAIQAIWDFLNDLVLTEENYTTEEKAKLALLNQNVYEVNLNASADVATRLSGLIEGTNYPAGWVLAADSAVNLLITHTLTGRKIADVKVWEIDGENETLAKPFSDGYEQIVANGMTVKIVGLDTLAVALRIELIFN